MQPLLASLLFLSGAGRTAGTARGSILIGLAAGAMALTEGISGLGREKFIGREINAAEHIAGTVGGGGGALLLRDAEIVRRDQHLHIAHNLHDGEQPHRDINAAAAVAVEPTAVPAADPVGNMAAGVTVRAAVLHIGGQTDRLRYLDAGLGQHTAAGRIDRFAGVIGAEGLYVSFSAVKDYLLIENSNAAYHHGRGGRSRAYVQADVEEERHVDRIKALVERHRFQVQVNRDHVHAPKVGACCVCDQLVFVLCEVDAQIFQTVFITATSRVSHLPLRAPARKAIPPAFPPERAAIASHKTPAFSAALSPPSDFFFLFPAAWIPPP